MNERLKIVRNMYFTLNALNIKTHSQSYMIDILKTLVRYQQ